MGPKKKWNILSFHVLLAFSSNLLSVFNKCEIIKPARYPKIAIWYILKKHRIKRIIKKWCRVQCECIACWNNLLQMQFCLHSLQISLFQNYFYHVQLSVLMNNFICIFARFSDNCQKINLSEFKIEELIKYSEFQNKNISG